MPFTALPKDCDGFGSSSCVFVGWACGCCCGFQGEKSCRAGAVRMVRRRRCDLRKVISVMLCVLVRQAAASWALYQHALRSRYDSISTDNHRGRLGIIKVQYLKSMRHVCDCIARCGGRT